MSLVEPAVSRRLAAVERQMLLELARASIARALRGETPVLAMSDYPAALQERAATFVTLHVAGDLRGCIGNLDADRPLAQDVIENARAAALRDTRFAPLTHAELARLEVHISILSAAEPLRFASEDDLLARLRPGVDGVILTERHYHATFLPAVWETLPDARGFLRALKHKAGLAPDYWSDTIAIERYTVESVP